MNIGLFFFYIDDYFKENQKNKKIYLNYKIKPKTQREIETFCHT